MLFPQEDAPLLKAWVVKRLETSSDADGDVLSDYVLALLQHEGSVDDVRKLCETEVPDFLNEDSDAFIRDVFHAIQYKTYLPGAELQPQNTFPATVPPPPQGGLSYDEVSVQQQPPYNPAQPSPQNASRKRTFGDTEDVEMTDAMGYGQNGFKQARRGRGGRMDYSSGYGHGGSSQAGFPPPVGGYQPQQSHYGGAPPLSGSTPAFDPANMSLESFMQQMQASMPLPPMPGFPPQGQQQGYPGPPPNGKLCRDYATKGYCARGSSCRFEHPTTSHYIPYGAPQQQSSVEYDPTKAAMGIDLPAPTRLNQPFNTRGGRNSRPQHDGRLQHNQPRASFSVQGPVNDRSKTKIVVENIPESHFTEEAVREFFSQFGNIVEVTMQAYKHLAIVKYDSWDSANAAYRSPKVIFDNRFVKVFWYREGDTSIIPPSAKGQQGTQNGRQGSQQPAAAATAAAPANGNEALEEIDMEEFKRKQEEAQKAFLEKQQKAQELEKQREEIERKRKELAQKQAAEKQKLLAAIAKKTNTPATNGGTDEPGKKPSSQTEALRAQLAALEAEALQLGIDPDAAMAESDGSGWNPGYRGRGRGRGRGGFPPRGRGAFTPRGSFRGGAGVRGGRGGGVAAYAAYSLDNRPKKVAITGVDFTDPSNGEPLRQYLFGVGEFTEIQESPVVTNITFKDRKTAESFFRGIPNKQIPGVQGQVELRWVNNDGTMSTPAPKALTAGVKTGPKPQPSAGASKAPAENGRGHGHGHDTTMHESGNVASSTKSDDDVQIVTESRGDDSKMDYDVADDENEWND